MERSALQFAVQSGVSISKIVLYMAESVPLVLARRALGIGNRPDPGPSKNHRNILFSEILNMLKDDFTNISNQLYPPESLAAFSPTEHAKRRPEFDWALKGFPKDFHEPFYANYIQTPLRTLLSKNLAVVEEKYRFLSKSLLARKI